MNELICAIIGLAGGFALATLRTRRQRDADLASARANLRREQRRNAELLCTAKQMQEREHIAAAQIVALSYALHDATTKVAQAHEATAVIGADPQALLRRFSRN